jgi:hypothetical protein
MLSGENLKKGGSGNQGRNVHNELHPRARFLLKQLIWGIPLLVAACALAVWLLSMGAKGSVIAGTLGLPVGIVGLGIAVLSFLYQIGEYTPPGGKNGASPQRLRLVALVTGVVLGVGGGLFYWTVIHKTDIPVTDRVLVFSGEGMHDGEQATIQIPGLPPQRRHLAITPTLINPANVGDCVTPARLNLTPVIDGQQREPISVRPGHEARLDLTGVTHQASVLVALYTPDTSCKIDLGVGQAVLYN